ncbi:hypothetical protein KSP39_PZI017414 [Platanthera zijinensis]|uniref:Uncharacterized protein n=1 Tax=Platanthera zijinensis TaxID=2320716 RepID=A0AAP0B4I6_9ASPA
MAHFYCVAPFGLPVVLENSEARHLAKEGKRSEIFRVCGGTSTPGPWSSLCFFFPLSFSCRSELEIISSRLPRYGGDNYPFMPHLFFATPLCARISILPTIFSVSGAAVFPNGHLRRRRNITTTDASNGLDAPLGGETVGGREIPEGGGAVSDKESKQPVVTAPPAPSFVSSSIPAIAKDIKKVIRLLCTNL